MNGPTRFLLVEDNDDHALLVAAAFDQTAGISTLDRVEDGEQALRFLRGEPPYAGRPGVDVVLLDVNLPKGDGFDVLRAIRGDSQLRTVPVVVLSTSVAEKDVIRAYAEGANSYVVKPVGHVEWERVLHTLQVYWSTCHRSCRTASPLPPRRPAP